jgi:hypothetical protein
MVDVMSVEAMKLIRDAIVQGVDLKLIGAEHILDKAIAEAEKQNLEHDTWMQGKPPVRGVYQVKRVGESSATRGFAYWNGERWGIICAKRAYAQEIRDMGRKAQTKYPMSWLKKVPRKPKEQA